MSENDVLQTTTKINTMELVKKTCEELEAGSVLVLAARDSCDLDANAAQPGLVGYFMEDSTKDMSARANGRGDTDRSASATQAAAEDGVGNPASTLVGEHLTGRQREVLFLLTKGMSNNQIAEQLSRSPYTIRHHVSELIAKLGAHNRAEAAAIAVKHRLVK